MSALRYVRDALREKSRSLLCPILAGMGRKRCDWNERQGIKPFAVTHLLKGNFPGIEMGIDKITHRARFTESRPADIGKRFSCLIHLGYRGITSFADHEIGSGNKVGMVPRQVILTEKAKVMNEFVFPAPAREQKQQVSSFQ